MAARANTGIHTKPATKPATKSAARTARPLMAHSRVIPAAPEPSARARALLRGREIADEDLKQSGGAFDLQEVCKMLHDISRQRVDQLVKSGQLLAVPGPSNRRRYPVVQFNADGTLVDGLKDVQAALPTRNPWAILNFLIHPDDRLRNKKPIDLLRKGDIPAVVKAASMMAEPGA